MKIYQDEYYLDNMILGMKNFSSLHRYAVNGKTSGNLACIAEIKNALVVMCSPRGCGFHYRYHARARHSAFYDLECLDLREKDIIFGTEEKLCTLLRKLDKEKQPEMIFILPSVISDIINDDIDGIVKNLQAEIKAVLIPVKSQAFSHMDKVNSRKIISEKAKQKINAKFSSTAVYPGCGYVEVMDALVNNVMEVQEVQPLSINLESFIWGYNGAGKVQSMVEMFRRMGIKVNAFLPAADLNSIKHAPAAQLNIVRRKKWALTMQERFNTPFIHIANMQDWHGLDGIKDFYLTVAQKLGIQEQAESVLQDDFLTIQDRYLALRKQFSRYKFCLITHGMAALVDAINCYQKDYGLPLHKICILLSQDYYKETGINEELLNTFRNKAMQTLASVNCEAEIVLQPDDKELEAAIDACDFLICDKNPYYMKFAKPILPDFIDRSVWSYQDFVYIMEEIANILKMHIQPSGNLLLRKVDYDLDYFPMRQNDDVSLAARAMFSKLWRQRK